MRVQDLRKNQGISQQAVAEKLNMSSITYSNYERGATPFPIEDCIILENEFCQPLDWDEQIDKETKEDLIECFNRLVKRYPLLSVLSFMQKNIKGDQKFNEPGRTIKHYVNNMHQDKENPLLPPDVGE